MKKNALKSNQTLVLGIESSCDETAAAVVRGTEVLSNEIASQIEIHKRFGGVVPEVASRNHTLAVLGVVDNALKKAGVALGDIDLIAVTSRPGLVGALMVGVATAEALSLAANKPLVKVNHIESHICACYACEEPPEPPFLALVASGGHTSIIDVTGYSEYNVIAGTTDDAIGEAFDKVARLLGLPYPGGPNIDRLAKNGSPQVQLMRRKGVNADLSLSYSGLKTAAVNYVHNLRQKGQEIPIEDICASFTAEAVDMLVATLMEAARRLDRKTIAISGGVAANSYLRQSLKTQCENKYALVIPPPILCTDNAVMVAIRGALAGVQA